MFVVSQEYCEKQNTHDSNWLTFQLVHLINFSENVFVSVVLYYVFASLKNVYCLAAHKFESNKTI